MIIIVAGILIIFGLILRLLAMRKLSKDFTMTIERPSIIQTSGPYKYVRHPAYIGSLLIILGASLISSSLGIFTLSWAFYNGRATEEEKIIDCPQYRNYQSKTGMFVPKIQIVKRIFSGV